MYKVFVKQISFIFSLGFHPQDIYKYPKSKNIWSLKYF